MILTSFTTSADQVNRNESQYVGINHGSFNRELKLPEIMHPTSITSVLIDDDSQALDILEELLQNIEGMEIKSKCNKSTEALPCIIKHKPDIVFLDIDMPEKDGIELAKEIRDMDIDTSIVFITAFNEHAIKAFKVAAFDYILKPIDPAELKNTIERLKQSRTKHDLSQKIDKLTRTLAPEKVRFNTRNGFIMINPNDIIYCEADGNYTFVHLHNDTVKHVTQQIGKVYSKLDPGVFLRINRSVVVNRNSIVSFNRSGRIKVINSMREIELRVAKEVVKELCYMFYRRHSDTEFFCHKAPSHQETQRSVCQQFTSWCVLMSPILCGKTSVAIPQRTSPELRVTLRNLPGLHPPQQLHDVKIARCSACPAHSGIFEVSQSKLYTKRSNVRNCKASLYTIAHLRSLLCCLFIIFFKC